LVQLGCRKGTGYATSSFSDDAPSFHPSAGAARAWNQPLRVGALAAYQEQYQKKISKEWSLLYYDVCCQRLRIPFNTNLDSAPRKSFLFFSFFLESAVFFSLS